MLVNAEIFVADHHNDSILFTDHRAIIGQLSHKSLATMSASGSLIFSPPSRQSLAPSCIKVPLKLEKAKYQTFQYQVNSTKKLVQSYPFIPLPLVVNDINSLEKLICDLEGVKSMMRDYFTRLYDHSGVPELPKPWLTTPSVVDVQDRVKEDPFIWPRRVSLADFRALL